MITIDFSSLIYYTCFFFVWLLDSMLNSALAQRMGEGKRIFLIPFYSYYRFGVLNGIHSVLVIMGLATSVIATLWLAVNIPVKYIIIITLVSILVNTAIISRSAISLAKTKWQYACSSILGGLIGICLEPLILTIIITYDSYILIFFLLLLQALFVQLSKIMLIVISSKGLKGTVRNH